MLTGEIGIITAHCCSSSSGRIPPPVSFAARSGDLVLY